MVGPEIVLTSLKTFFEKLNTFLTTPEILNAIAILIVFMAIFKLIQEVLMHVPAKNESGKLLTKKTSGIIGAAFAMITVAGLIVKLPENVTFLEFVAGGLGAIFVMAISLGFGALIVWWFYGVAKKEFTKLSKTAIIAWTLVVANFMLMISQLMVKSVKSLFNKQSMLEGILKFYTEKWIDFGVWMWWFIVIAIILTFSGLKGKKGSSFAKSQSGHIQNALQLKKYIANLKKNIQQAKANVVKIGGLIK